MKKILHAALVVAATFAHPAAAEERPPAPVVFRLEVSAPPAAVWDALTTEAGAGSFFAPAAAIEPRIGGAYEIYFDPGEAPGRRGTEGVRILAMEEPNRLMVGWNSPVRFGALREQQTVVEFALEPLGADRTLLTATHSGWGRGAAWERIRGFFASAWPLVLGRLQYRFDHGPIDWNGPPDGIEYFRPAS